MRHSKVPNPSCPARVWESALRRSGAARSGMARHVPASCVPPFASDGRGAVPTANVPAVSDPRLPRCWSAGVSASLGLTVGPEQWPDPRQSCFFIPSSPSFQGQIRGREKDPPYVPRQTLADASPDGSSHSAVPSPCSFHGVGSLLCYQMLSVCLLFMCRETGAPISEQGREWKSNRLL